MQQNYVLTHRRISIAFSLFSLIQLYPGQVSLASFDALCGALQRVQDWDTLAILLLAVRKLLHEQGSTGTGTGTGSANIAPIVPLDGSEQEHGSPFLLELSPIELKQKVLDVVNMCLGKSGIFAACFSAHKRTKYLTLCTVSPLHFIMVIIEANVQGALTAAKKLVNDYKLVELLAQVK